jgi:capsular exopolysaccharide synthesis family protein
MEPSPTARPEARQRQQVPGLEHSLKVLRRRWWIILLCAIVTGGAAFAISHSQTKKYTARASLLFNNTSVAQQASGIQAVSQTDPQGQRNTNLTLVQLGSAVANRTARLLGGGITPGEVKGAVSASLVGQSNVVAVSATWPNPRIAASIANTYAQAFIDEQAAQNARSVQSAIQLVKQQYAGLTKAQRLDPQGQSLVDHLESLKILKAMQNSTQIVQSAGIPGAPSSPRTSRNTVLGVILGLILGIGLAFLLERLDRGLREPREVEEAFGLPTLGVIPRSQVAEGRSAPLEADLEPFRMLRAHLRYFNVDRELKVLLVTSAKPAEGKTTVARNLATTAAGLGTRTLLLEADLRKPALAQRLGLEPGVGLAGALVGVGSLQDAIQHVDVAARANGDGTARRLDVLPTGSVPPNPTELLESHAIENVLAWAREHYELVIVDTPPLLVVSDTIPLMKLVDGVIVVSRLGISTRDSVDQFREQLVNLRAPVLGIVVNDVRARGDFYYGYSYEGGPSDGATQNGVRAAIDGDDLVAPGTSEEAATPPAFNAPAIHEPSATGARQHESQE